MSSCVCTRVDGQRPAGGAPLTAALYSSAQIGTTATRGINWSSDAVNSATIGWSQLSDNQQGTRIYLDPGTLRARLRLTCLTGIDPAPGNVEIDALVNGVVVATAAASVGIDQAGSAVFNFPNIPLTYPVEGFPIDGSTRFCSYSGATANNWPNLAQDLSLPEWNEDLTDFGVPSTRGAAFSLPYAQTANLQVGTREALVQMRESALANSGWLMTSRNNAAGSFAEVVGWAIRYAGGATNNLAFQASDGATVRTAVLTPPGITSSLQSFYIAAVTEPWDVPDPLRTTLRIWRLSGATIVETASVEFTHPFFHVPVGAGFILGGLAFNTGAHGNDWSFDGNTISFARVSNRARSQAEIEAGIPIVANSYANLGSPTAKAALTFQVRMLENSLRSANAVLEYEYA